MMDRCLLHTSDVHSPQKQRGNTWQLEKFRSFPAVPAVGGRSNPVPHVPHLRLRIATVILFQTPSTSGSILQTGYMGSAKVAMSAPRIVLQKPCPFAVAAQQILPDPSRSSSRYTYYIP